jgi:hypothetical protein
MDASSRTDSDGRLCGHRRVHGPSSLLLDLSNLSLSLSLSVSLSVSLSLSTPLSQGEIIGLGLSGFLVTTPDIFLNNFQIGSWDSSFYVTSLLGALWFPLYSYFVFDSPAEHPRISDEEYEYIRQGYMSLCSLSLSLSVSLCLSLSVSLCLSLFVSVSLDLAVSSLRERV